MGAKADTRSVWANMDADPGLASAGAEGEDGVMAGDVDMPYAADVKLQPLSGCLIEIAIKRDESNEKVTCHCDQSGRQGRPARHYSACQ